jgi:hypothetical protein
MGDEVKAAAERLLAELDHIARDYDHYEYGLPLHETDDDHHGRMVAAVTAALNPAAGWRPIADAPRDGTRVLLAWRGRPSAFIIGWWGPKKSRFGVNYGDAWGKGDRWDDTFVDKPTHFMLIPEPPPA